MVLPIKGVHQLGATASGVDRAGHAVRVDLTAYVIDAEDAGVAISVVEAQVMNEAVIPDGAGGFNKPTLVTATSVEPSAVLPVAPLVHRHKGPGADEKLPVNGVYAVQVFASMTFEDVSATLTVYPLNLALKASLAQAESDVIQLPILTDPESGQMDKPDKVVAISGAPVSSAPVSAIILVPSVVIPDWPDAETVDRGGGGLPSANALGLIASFIAVPNDGTHDAGDVISLSPPAGSAVAIGSLVTVKIWGRSE